MYGCCRLEVSYSGQGLARVEESGHLVTPGAAVHRHTLDRVNAVGTLGIHVATTSSLCSVIVSSLLYIALTQYLSYLSYLIHYCIIILRIS